MSPAIPSVAGGPLPRGPPAAIPVFGAEPGERADGLRVDLVEVAGRGPVNNCAEVRASPLAWCGRWTGSPMPSAAADKPGAASTATWGRSASAGHPAREPRPRALPYPAWGPSAALLVDSKWPRESRRAPVRRGPRGCDRSANHHRVERPSNCPGRTMVSDASPMIPALPFDRNPGDGADLVVPRVGTGHLAIPRDGERRITPGNGPSGRRRPQVALHGPGVAFGDEHHAKARAELKLRRKLGLDPPEHPSRHRAGAGVCLGSDPSDRDGRPGRSPARSADLVLEAEALEELEASLRERAEVAVERARGIGGAEPLRRRAGPVAPRPGSRSGRSRSPAAVRRA